MILKLLYLVILVSFFIRTLRNSLYICFLLQLKEYRLDRLISFFKSGQGKRIIFHPFSLIKWFLISLIIIIHLNYYFIFMPSVNLFGLLFFLYLFFWITWIVEAICYIRELLIYRWKVPVLSPKAVTLLIFSLFFQFSPLLIDYLLIPLIIWPLLDRLLFIILIFLSSLLQFPAFFIKKYLIAKAKRKIAQFPNLTVIGITGSYGKTTTKELLSSILAEKYKVLKTKDYNNTILAITKTILKDLDPSHEIFIVEMGAYKRGEIREICKLVSPKIGIITGINEQHLELFGSIEKTMKAKFELIESLADNGTAIFNGDNDHVMEMMRWAGNLKTDLNLKSYQLLEGVVTKTNNKLNTLFASNLKIQKNKTSLRIIRDKENYSLEIPLIGSGSTENLLAALSVYIALGNNLYDILGKLDKLSYPSHTMNLRRLNKNVTMVDDTFNANPNGIEASLKYMKIYQGKKYLILTPLIELGKGANSIHKTLGNQMAKISDKIFLTNRNYFDSLTASFNVKDKELNKFKVINYAHISSLIRELSQLEKDSIVIFSGKEAGKVLQKISNYVS